MPRRAGKSGHRPKRESKNKKAGKARSPGPRKRHVSHPTFGKIPLLPRVVEGKSGQETVWCWDPSYVPNLPAGAVRGDIRKQSYGLGVPHYYYLDREQSCVQCRQFFTFSAREQKYWYESLGFVHHSVAVRCPLCRRRRRSQAAVQRQLAFAKQIVKRESSDPLAYLALAEAICLHHERIGSGLLDQGIAAARKARRLDPSQVETWYWEGRCQQHAGRTERAKEAYTHFVELAGGVLRCRSLYRKARGRIGLL